ncbi:hypothetical protein [Catellatospora citrea]|uniref:Uncharacterized protein n=1 Tax=Catellatospora citrea TaxID=53366 RepID=A0A8J3KKU6_9ACTN|nr:hypothetical protein [Catellatospora citrea]RKE10487.1 hypothetical protein C8E86_5390 [Catellatospora citrea]GIF99003.1 hypothetical protein Cci01nite_40970 [Catellatospora citrea]
MPTTLPAKGWRIPDPAQPEVIEHDDMLWKPIEGATATADEFVAARALMIALHDSWNPWERQDRAGEYDAVVAVFEQWTRAEPGFRVKTAEDIDAWMAEMDERFKRERQESERERLARVPLYDEGRFLARWALREQQAILDHNVRERDELHARTSGAAMDERRRAGAIAQLDEVIAGAERRIAVLSVQVGDSETVFDPRGRLPAQRRASALTTFSIRREKQVYELREKVTSCNLQLKSTKGRAARASIRDELHRANGLLERLLAVPRLTADDMCGDCDLPANWHGWSFRGYGGLLGEGPCPAWPGWAERIRRAREMFLAATDRQTPAPPSPPKPEPLAVIPSGLSIDDMITQLAAARAEHPKAVVRRGNRNRLELWPE